MRTSAATSRERRGRTTGLVDRHTNLVVYENTIGSNFVAKYPGINERDASLAYDISAPGVIGATRVFGAGAIYEGGFVELWNNNERVRDFFGGDSIEEASQGTWNDAYQSYLWVTGISAIAGPTVVVLEQINPLNYATLQLDPFRGETARGTQARNGALSTSGFGSRRAQTRAEQLDTHLLAQSVTLFLMDLARAEDVSLTRLVACNASDASAKDLVEAVRMREKIVTDDCTLYNKRDDNRGFGISTYQ